MSSSKSLSKPAKRGSAKKDFRPKGRLPSLAKRRDLAEKVILKLRSIDPDPQCELYHNTGYQLLVSVVLSAQTTDKMVNRVMEPLYDQGFTPETVIEWGPDKLLQKIKTIGLAPTKAKMYISSARSSSKILEERFRKHMKSSNHSPG